jgi:hypothetical protein
MGDGTFYTTKKIFVAKDGSIIGAAGHSGDCSRFIEWAIGGFRGTRPKFESDRDDDDGMEALILRKDGIYYFHPDYPSPERLNDVYYAIGSGGQAAMIAMHHIGDPVKAVEETFTVNHHCGPPVQVLKLNETKGA